MHTKLVALSITLIASASVAMPAFAQAQEGGARFRYAPNIWKMEDAHMPQDRYPTAPIEVRPGMEGQVPHGTSFLGIDPQLLSKPVAVPTVHATSRPVTVQAPRQISAPFRSDFGQPVKPEAANIASLPKMAAPKSLPESSAAKAVSAKRLPGQSSLAANRNVHGKLLSHKHAIGNSVGPAMALKNIDSYGKNAGYVPGQYLPTSSGAGMNTRADVTGRLLRN